MMLLPTQEEKNKPPVGAAQSLQDCGALSLFRLQAEEIRVINTSSKAWQSPMTMFGRKRSAVTSFSSLLFRSSTEAWDSSNTGPTSGYATYATTEASVTSQAPQHSVPFLLPSFSG